MSLQQIIGKDCILAYDGAADWAAPTWNDIPAAIDVACPGLTKNVVDLLDRAASGWNLKGAGMRAIDLTFGYLYRIGGGDTVFDDLWDSYENDTPLMFAVLDGPSAGILGRKVCGFRFVGFVSEMPMTEELEGARRFDVKVDATRYVLSNSLLLPEWYELDALTPPD